MTMDTERAGRAVDGGLWRAGGGPPGTLESPIIDSAMTEAEVFDGLDRKCPKRIRSRQRIVPVCYYSFDGKVHCGQLVVDAALEEDVRHVFGVAWDAHFPFGCVIPISHPSFRKDGRWDDNLSMAANNTSAFNYRSAVGSTELSAHAFGLAIDINPLQNPYLRGEVVLPAAGAYEPGTPGTLTTDHPVVCAFRSRGWQWGGDWPSPRDYQHLEKNVAAHRSSGVFRAGWSTGCDGSCPQPRSLIFTPSLAARYQKGTNGETYYPPFLPAGTTSIHYCEMLFSGSATAGCRAPAGRHIRVRRGRRGRHQKDDEGVASRACAAGSVSARRSRRVLGGVPIAIGLQSLCPGCARRGRARLMGQIAGRTRVEALGSHSRLAPRDRLYDRHGLDRADGAEDGGISRLAGLQDQIGRTDDLTIVRELRKHTGAAFRVDANCAWTAAETVRNSTVLQELGVEFIEQPLAPDRWSEMQAVFAQSALPIFADESCRTELDVDRCADCFHGVNVKLSKCGGLTPARRIVARARQLGLKTMVGCGLETSVGISAAAQLLPLLDYADLDGALLLAGDIATGVTIDRGRVCFPQENGCGVRLSPRGNSFAPRME